MWNFLEISQWPLLVLITEYCWSASVDQELEVLHYTVTPFLFVRLALANYNGEILFHLMALALWCLLVLFFLKIVIQRSV